MPGLFMLGLVFVVITIGALLVLLFSWKNRNDTLTAGASAVVAGLALIGAFGSVFFSSFNSVGTYDIGVTTNFGKVISYVGPGAHFIPPWDNMSLMDESVQTVDQTLKVRVAGQQTADADVKLRVQLVPGATDALFKQYKGNTANVISALVLPSLNVAMNSVYDGYDPILPLSTGAKAGSTDNPSTAQLSAKVQETLSAKIGTQVKVDTLVVAPLVYDKTVTDRINSVLSQTAQTDKAKEAVKTAQQQADANNILQGSLAKNPLVLANRCFDEIADGQLNPPAGFSCYPNGSSSVVIPAEGK